MHGRAFLPVCSPCSCFFWGQQASPKAEQKNPNRGRGRGRGEEALARRSDLRSRQRDPFSSTPHAPTSQYSSTRAEGADTARPAAIAAQWQVPFIEPLPQHQMVRAGHPLVSLPFRGPGWWQAQNPAAANRVALFPTLDQREPAAFDNAARQPEANVQHLFRSTSVFDASFLGWSFLLRQSTTSLPC